MLEQYKEFIEELKVELADGTLSEMDEIKVLRSNEAVDGYKAIIDWYYDDITMESLLQADALDTEEDKKELLEVKTQYLSFKPFLESIKIDDCMQEMYEVVQDNR